jgi:hypothetical protein
MAINRLIYRRTGAGTGARAPRGGSEALPGAPAMWFDHGVIYFFIYFFAARR